MRPSSRAWAAFGLLYGVLLAWQVDRWFFTPHGLVSTWDDRRSTLSVSAGTPGGLSQSFVMGADGLDGLWLRPVSDTRAVAGELLVDVLAVEGGRKSRVERVAMPAAAVASSRSLHVPLRSQRHSRGRAYEVVLRHVHFDPGPALAFVVTRENQLADGRLFADGVEQWGDLVFETSSGRATLPFWLHEVLRPWPAWVRAWPTVTGVLVVFNLLLAWACAQATGVVGPRGEALAVESRVRPAPVDPRRVGRLAVGALVVAGIVVAILPTPSHRTLHLVDALPEAAIETTWSVLHDGVSPGPVVFNGRIHRSIVAMPTTRLSWTVDVPPDAVLKLGAAMRPDMWEKESDGIQMRVAITHAGARTVASDLTFFPLGVPEHRRLFTFDVPLQRWAGQRIVIELETTPERWGNAVNDVPVWADPRIEWPRHHGAGVARIVREGQ